MDFTNKIVILLIVIFVIWYLSKDKSINHFSGSQGIPKFNIPKFNIPSMTTTPPPTNPQQRSIYIALNDSLLEIMKNFEIRNGINNIKNISSNFPSIIRSMSSMSPSSIDNKMLQQAQQDLQVLQKTITNIDELYNNKRISNGQIDNYLLGKKTELQPYIIKIQQFLNDSVKIFNQLMPTNPPTNPVKNN